VEDDPGQYDLRFWLDYFKRTHSDAACLSAGGCVAYYPTQIPLHYRSAWLKDGDAFGELVAGCRALGMVVIARTDPHAVHQDVFDAHPDWIAVDAQGQKRKHWATPEPWVTCALGPYNFEFMTEVTKEIVSKYRVDGVFSHRWAGSGMCDCKHCRQNFKTASGLELPRSNDPQNPSRRAYLFWRQQRLFELWQLWDTTIRQINPAACYITNAGGGALSDLDMKAIGERSPILFADRQARHGLMAPWANGKEYRSTMGRKRWEASSAWGWRSRTVGKTRCRTRQKSARGRWMESTTGCGRGSRNSRAHYMTGGGCRWSRNSYGWLYRNEHYLRHEASLARLALVYSQQTAWFYGAIARRRKWRTTPSVITRR